MIEADLLGQWRLHALVLRHGSEESHPFGRRPQGRLLVSANGELFVAVFAEKRQHFASGDLQSFSPDEAVAALQTAIVYFGRWHFDEGTCTLETTVQGALFPNWEGSVQSRMVAIPGTGELTLTTPPVAWDGDAPQGVVHWRRMPDDLPAAR